MKMRPIDKSKKSNRRCVNCVHWGDKAEKGINQRWEKLYFCNVPKNGKKIDYWNCCSCFEWNPNKNYVKEEKQ